MLLEGHVAGAGPEESAALGRFFASWPVPFTDDHEARLFLGTDAIVDAWIADLEVSDEGLRPRFDPDVMERTIAAVHEPRWDEWRELEVPTLVVFAKHGMFSDADKDELIRSRPAIDGIDLSTGSHDAHLDALEEWVRVLKLWLSTGEVVPR